MIRAKPRLPLVVVVSWIGIVMSAGWTRAESPESLERQILEATNAFRKDNQLGPLIVNDTLQKIAHGHARNMARQDKYGDTDDNGHTLDGKGPEDRIKEGGYKYAAFAENVGFQQGAARPAVAMMEGWKNSPGHRANLLNKSMTEIGVGAAQGKSGRWYFVQDFGRPESAMVKVRCQIENRTREAVTFTLHGDGKPFTLPAGRSAVFTLANASDQPTLRFSANAGAAPTDAPLHDGRKYAVERGEAPTPLRLKDVGALP